MRVFIVTISILPFAFSDLAFAHVGHIGEWAGHAHWVGVAAVLGVVGLAAVLGKGKASNNEEQSQEECRENGIKSGGENDGEEGKLA